jgi:hypothetical protein
MSHAAEARDYRDTLVMERQMREDPEYQRRWTEEQAACESLPLFDEEGEDAAQVDEAVALTEVD